MLLAASTDNCLRVFSVDQISDADNKDDGAVTLNFVSKLQKESGARVL